jgi:hypothetical protein
MPRKQKQKRRTRRRPYPSMSISGGDKTEVVPGKILIPVSLASAAPLVIPLALSSLGARLSALGTCFQEHRFTSLRIAMHPAMLNIGGVRTSYAVGYFKVLPLTPPTTMVQLYTAASSRYSDLGDTLPVYMNLNRSVLLHTVRPWFTNQAPGGSEALDTSQGVIYVIGSGTTLSCMLEISYVCELRGPTSPPVD